MRIFIICNSENLPSPETRDPNSIYFVYDTLDVYFGRTQYAGLYCIVAEVPDGSDPDAMPVKNMLYFKMNGDVWVVNGETPEKIAEIADPSMTVYLEKAGTTFLLRSGYRYIDKQTKAINLPYQNGTNQYSAMVDKPIEYTNDTIMIFNPETGEFEPEGLRHYDEFGRSPDTLEILKYTVENTDTVNTTINNEHMHADVKISNRHGNALKVFTDGLYASADDFVTSGQFENLKTIINGEIGGLRGIMADLQEYLDNEHIDITLSDETLKDKIEDYLKDKFGDEVYEQLLYAITHYAEVEAAFRSFENEQAESIRINLDDLRADTQQRIEDVSTSWGYFTDDFITEIEKIDDNRYQITTPFIVEDDHNLRYTISDDKIYVYKNQIVNDYIQFNSGDVITVELGKTINIVYCYEDEDDSKVESCSYCEAF